MKTIVGIVGTNRKGNYTSHALKVVMDELRRLQATPILFDAGEMTLSFPGQPEGEDVVRLRSQIKEAAGVVLATPEYHGSFSAVTKLIIENLGFPSALAGKPIALVGVASGRIGAVKALEHLKGVCSHIGALVIPGSVSIAGVRQIFSDTGECLDADAEKMLRNVASSLLTFIKDYVCPKYVLEDMVRSGEHSWTTLV